MSNEKIRVLIAASEAVPFAKASGQADVVGALAKEFKKNGVEIRIIIPKYSAVYDYIEQNKIKIEKTTDIFIKIRSKEIKASVDQVTYNGVVYYFVDNPFYFKRNGIYMDSKTRIDYSDSLERFVFFCKSVLEYARACKYKPDIIQCNNWQNGLIPVYLKTLYKKDPFFKNTYTIQVIHNLYYQGIFPVEQFTMTGIEWKYYGDDFEYFGYINILKGAIIFSDMIVTVSKTYANEIQTSEFGCALDKILKVKYAQGKLIGIVNGADYTEWNPAGDIHLKNKYNITYDIKSLENKKRIKKMFLSDSGLVNADPNTPLLGMVSRLADQKGFDLIFHIIDKLLKTGVYFTVLGIGKHEYEERLKTLKKKYPDQTAVFIDFNIPLSHYIESAADIFLMPSRFEPCGLNQIYSLKYGTIPVVRNTGGLADTVRDGKTGFVFSSYSPDEFLSTLNKAINTYKNEPEKWGKMIEKAMKENWSWGKAAKKYCELYRKMLNRPRETKKKVKSAKSGEGTGDRVYRQNGV